MRLDSTLGWAGMLAVLTGCAARGNAPAVVPLLPPEQVAVRVYLIGDAGAPAPGGEPVFEALTRELKSTTGERVVVWVSGCVMHLSMACGVAGPRWPGHVRNHPAAGGLPAGR